jgi:hypothetical protein
MPQVTKTQLGQAAIYNSGMVTQSGGAMNFGANLNKANQFAKDYRVVSKTRGVTDALGLTGFLDKKTGGLYSKGTDLAKSKGYGKKKTTRKKK